MSDEELETPGPGELYRLLGRFEHAMDSGFTRIDDRLDNFRKEFVTRELYESERNSLQQQVTDIEHSGRARWQTIAATLAGVGGVVSAAIAVVSRVH